MDMEFYFGHGCHELFEHVRRFCLWTGVDNMDVDVRVDVIDVCHVVPLLFYDVHDDDCWIGVVVINDLSSSFVISFGKMERSCSFFIICSLRPRRKALKSNQNRQKVLSCHRYGTHFR